MGDASVSLYNGRRRSQLQSGSQARINIVVTDSPLEGNKGRFSRALARGNIVLFETIMQCNDDPFNFRI